MEYEEWTDEVEVQVWYKLDEELVGLVDAKALQSLYEEGYSPDDVVEHLYGLLESDEDA